jgi:hypothetical protein
MGAFGDWWSACDLAEIDYDGQSLQVDAPAVLDGVQVLLPNAAQKSKPPAGAALLVAARG